jgi:hypothetical protein
MPILGGEVNQRQVLKSAWFEYFVEGFLLLAKRFKFKLQCGERL